MDNVGSSRARVTPIIERLLTLKVLLLRVVSFFPYPRYESGSVAGRVIKDRLIIGGMTVSAVEMGLVRQQEQHIQGFKADGIVGLAFPSISTTHNTSPSQHSTFVELLRQQFGAAGDVFSVFLTRELKTSNIAPLAMRIRGHRAAGSLVYDRIRTLWFYSCSYGQQLYCVAVRPTTIMKVITDEIMFARYPFRPSRQ